LLWMAVFTSVLNVAVLGLSNLDEGECNLQKDEWTGGKTKLAVINLPNSLSDNNPRGP